MGTWENLKNLVSLGSNVVKAGSKAISTLEKIETKRQENAKPKYRVPDMVPESDNIFLIEYYYVMNMRDALKKMVVEEYESTRMDLEYIYKYVKDMLESVVKLVEVNYVYRKNVLKLDDMKEMSIDQYMNSRYVLESDICKFMTLLNKLLIQIDRDKNSLAKKKLNNEMSLAAIKDIIDSLGIE